MFEWKLMRSEVEFLGYVVSTDGISTYPKKVAAVKMFPRPVDLKSLRAFLGLTLSQVQPDGMIRPIAFASRTL